MRTRFAFGRSVPGFEQSALDESIEADLFIEALLGEVAETEADIDAYEDEDSGELVEVCGFLGPNDVRRPEQQIRDAVVTRTLAEWTAWHTTAGAPRLESDIGMFGQLVGYYLAAVGSIRPDTLTAMQAAAVGGINYGALLAAGATAPTIDREVVRIRDLLLAAAPGATRSLHDPVAAAIRHARQAHTNTGDFSAWSAAFVTACVRGAGIAQGLEAVIAPGRKHIGSGKLLLASLTHAAYTIAARRRRAATAPPLRGTYHAFTPARRAPQLGDLIVQDRRSSITADQVSTLATLPAGRITHGDIVVELQRDFAVAIGGNLGGSVRKRRFPRDAAGLLITAAPQLFTQENNAGVLPPVPAQSTQPLAGQSTRRIFAILSPVEECAAVPGQPYGGGVLV